MHPLDTQPPIFVSRVEITYARDRAMDMWTILAGMEVWLKENGFIIEVVGTRVSGVRENKRGLVLVDLHGSDDSAFCGFTLNGQSWRNGRSFTLHMLCELEEAIKQAIDITEMA